MENLKSKGEAIPFLWFFKMPRPAGGVIHFIITELKIMSIFLLDTARP
jgi:hypothetical protein